MNIHLFSDYQGIYIRYSYERMAAAELLDTNKIINIAACKLPETFEIHQTTDLSEAKAHIRSLGHIDKIICHPFTIETAEIIRYITQLQQKKPIVYWCCWSGEIYNMIFEFEDLLEPFSLQELRKLYESKKVNFARKISEATVGKFYFNKIIKQFRYLKYNQKIIKEFQLVDSFFALQKGDYEKILQLTKGTFPGNYKQFTYLSTEQFNQLDAEQIGNSIMIGHSSAYEGNQYEIMVKLKELSIESPLYMPLAYGIESYTASLKAAGEKLFGEQIYVQTTKLPPDIYYKQLNQIGFAIFNIKVQQGLGNIMGLLYSGRKVFLREESSIYQDLKERGVHIFSTNTELTKAALETPLTPQQREENKAILEALLSEEQVQAYWKPLLN